MRQAPDGMKYDAPINMDPAPVNCRFRLSKGSLTRTIAAPKTIMATPSAAWIHGVAEVPAVATPAQTPMPTATSATANTTARSMAGDSTPGKVRRHQTGAGAQPLPQAAYLAEGVPLRKNEAGTPAIAANIARRMGIIRMARISTAGMNCDAP